MWTGPWSVWEKTTRILVDKIISLKQQCSSSAGPVGKGGTREPHGEFQDGACTSRRAHFHEKRSRQPMAGLFANSSGIPLPSSICSNATTPSPKRQTATHLGIVYSGSHPPGSQRLNLRETPIKNSIRFYWEITEISFRKMGKVPKKTVRSF